MGRLRRLTPRELISILEENGFRAVRQSGSHLIVQHVAPQGTITIPVPMHRGQLKLGTLAAIIRRSGLDRAHFEEPD